MSTTTAALALINGRSCSIKPWATVLRAQESAKRQIGYWGMVRGRWRADRDLRSLVNLLRTLSEAPDGFFKDDEIDSQMQQVRKLLTSIEDLIDTAKRKGLMNRTLTGASLGSIRIRGESLADYLDNLEMAVDPEVTQAIAAGREQIANGEFETYPRRRTVCRCNPSARRYLQAYAALVLPSTIPKPDPRSPAPAAES